LKLPAVALPKVSGHPLIHDRREHQSATLLQGFFPDLAFARLCIKSSMESELLAELLAAHF